METPRIWTTKEIKNQTHKTPDESRSPSSKKSKPIVDVDVTYNDIVNPDEKDSLYPIFHFMKEYWVGKNKDRASNCRIGTMCVYFNDNGNIHMDFATKFALSKESQDKFLKALRSYLSSS